LKSGPKAEGAVGPERISLNAFRPALVVGVAPQGPNKETP
jgi:hypothetical protein